MYDAEDAKREDQEETWDQWYARTKGGGTKRLLIYTVIMMAAMVALFYSGNSIFSSSP